MGSEGWQPTCRLRIVQRVVRTHRFFPDECENWIEQAWERESENPFAHKLPDQVRVETQWRTIEIVDADGGTLKGARMVK